MRRVIYPSLIPLVVLITITLFGAANGAAQRRPSLELLDVKQSANQGSVILVGEVKNISPSDIGGVTVYCNFQNGAGKVIRTEQTNLGTDPLPPNKTSDFKCSTKITPEIKGYDFRFSRLFGGSLAVKDSRKK